MGRLFWRLGIVLWWLLVLLSAAVAVMYLIDALVTSGYDHYANRAPAARIACAAAACAAGGWALTATGRRRWNSSLVGGALTVVLDFVTILVVLSTGPT